MKKVAVVILNWNGKRWLEKFLPSVVQHTKNNQFEIIVVDNNSTDDSVEFIKKQYSSLQILEFKNNLGFTGGYNKALSQIKAKYFLLLNSDIEVTKNWLDILFDSMEKDATIGACQPKILSYHDKEYFEYAGASGGYIDKFGYPFCRGRIFTTSEKDVLQYESDESIFWATGACLLIRSELFLQLGGFDEDFFAHMEEIDLCWRVQNLGFQIKVFPKSIVYHVGGGTLATGSPRKTFLNFRNSLAMIFKNLPFPNNVVKVFIRLCLDGLAAIQFLSKGEIKNFLAIPKSHIAFYLWIPSLISKRKNIKTFKNLSQLNGTYSKSIVFQYFLKGLKHFSQLKVK